jgi:ERCC4-type nuclease
MLASWHTDEMIWYDHREQASIVPGLLSLRGLDVRAAQLPVGDYLVSDRVAIERKSASDFVSSVRDERLFEQVDRLRDAYPVAIVLVEGAVAWRDEIVRGVYGSLLRRGASVLPVADSADSAEWIALLAEQEARPAHQPRGFGRQQRDPDRLLEHMLAQLPGISLASAQRLLVAFGSLPALAGADMCQLQTVEGIGAKRAAAIITGLNRHYVHRFP